MSKPSRESFLDYKKRIIDSKSKSFCGAKWLNSTIWLASGKTASCCLPAAHDIDETELEKNPTAIHNTVYKKEMRRMMQNGERPSECEHCWKTEDVNVDSVSERVLKTLIYSDDDLDVISKADFQKNINLRTLEVAFDRNCQFACSYCNANFSTTWSQDIKKFGAYQNLKTDGSSHFITNGDESERYALGEKNPYTDAFWRWWPELSQTLQELRITGGEPLLSPHLWKLLDYFGDHKGSGNLLLSVNTNLGAKDELIDRLIEKSHYINRFKIFTSGEAVGKQAEYIRDGLDYQRWFANVEKVLLYARLERLNFMMTINAVSVFSLPEFLDLTLELKNRYSVGYIGWSFNILRFPSFQSLLVLPFEIRADAQAKITQWYDKNSHSKYVSETEKLGLQQLIEYLDPASELQKNLTQLEVLQSDFKNFYQQYDQRRNKKFSETFAASTVDWYNSIKTK